MASFSLSECLVGGAFVSEDRLLQSRLISYFSAHEYRVGTNHYKLPVNRPLNADGGTHNYSVDGQMNMGENKGTLNYEPSLVHKTYSDDPKARFHAQPLPKGTYVQEEIKKTLNFKQAGDLYRSFSEEMQANLVSNLAAKLADSQSELIKNTMSAHFYKADPDYGRRVAEAIGADKAEMIMIAAKLRE